jgi:membrane protein
LDSLRELKNAQTGGRFGVGLRELAVRLNADPLQMQQVLEQLQALDWIGLLNEDIAGQAPRYVLLVDVQSTLAAPLMTALLLADEPGSQAMQQQWRDCVLADVL